MPGNSVSAQISCFPWVQPINLSFCSYVGRFIHAGYHMYSFRPSESQTEGAEYTNIQPFQRISHFLPRRPSHLRPDCIFPISISSIMHAYLITPACPNAPTSSTQPAYSSPQSRQPGTLHPVLRRPINQHPFSHHTHTRSPRIHQSDQPAPPPQKTHPPYRN